MILSARALNPALFVVGRASTPSAEEKLARAGADRVVSPYTMAGRRLAELAVRPRVVDFLDAALSHGELSFSLEELHARAGSPLEGASVGQLRKRGLFVLAILGADDRYAANPPDDRRLVAGETLIASGSAEALAAARSGPGERGRSRGGAGMTPILIVIVATVVALAILAAAILAVARERSRRRRLRDEERSTTERVIWQRLDWVAPPALSISESASLEPADSAATAPLGELPAVVGTVPARLQAPAVHAPSASTEPPIPEPASKALAGLEPAVPRAAAPPPGAERTGPAGPWPGEAAFSPRRRLWRDSVAVLLVGVLVVLVFGLVGQPKATPQGAVLAATSAPATTAPAPAPTPTGGSSSGGGAAATPVPVATPSPTPPPGPSATPAPATAPVSSPTPVPAVTAPPATPVPARPHRTPTPTPTPAQTPVVVTPPPQRPADARAHAVSGAPGRSRAPGRAWAEWGP